jgi:hypothetical protein
MWDFMPWPFLLSDFNRNCNASTDLVKLPSTLFQKIPFMGWPIFKCGQTGVAKTILSLETWQKWVEFIV